MQLTGFLVNKVPILMKGAEILGNRNHSFIRYFVLVTPSANVGATWCSAIPLTIRMITPRADKKLPFYKNARGRGIAGLYKG